MNRKGRYRGQPLVSFDCDPADLPPEPLVASEGPLPPEPRKAPHEAGCNCIGCWNTGLRYGEYLHAKQLEW